MTRHFVCCVALGLLPAIHFICISPSSDVALAVPYLLAMFGFYAAGAFVYIRKWPESRWPGRFDIFGQSHQIWHICVVLAAVSWVHGCHVFLKTFTKSHCE